MDDRLPYIFQYFMAFLYRYKTALPSIRLCPKRVKKAFNVWIVKYSLLQMLLSANRKMFVKCTKLFIIDLYKCSCTIYCFLWKFFWDWSESYSEPTQTSKHLVNYFCKNLHLRCLIEFWMSLCWRLKHLNKLYNYSVVSNLIILISVFDYIACIFSWCPYLIISYKLALSLS